ncbi:MAG: cyclic nucleotide-binding domain-containing protein [Gammaproteobacteria bacterium]
MTEHTAVENITPQAAGERLTKGDIKPLIATLRPINRLPKHAVDSLVAQATCYRASVGETIKGRVSDENLVYFLIDGAIQVFTEDGQSETLLANEPSAKNALGRYAKSARDMVANCPSTLVRIPWESLEKFLIQYAPAELSSTLEVQEILSSTSSDWMVRLLQSELFALLPPGNIQKVLNSLDSIETFPEEIVITEGEQGEHFYIIDAGSFLVSKQNNKTGGEVELASLSTGDFFGEEALITGSPRGATITSTGVGRLIRINSDTFKSCIVAPSVPLLSADTAKSLVGNGAEVIDIRTPEMYASGAIPDSENLILARLRSENAVLDKQRTYIVVDDTPSAATHAAFLLRTKGFDARCLNLPLEKYAVLHGIELNAKDSAKPPHIDGLTPASQSTGGSRELKKGILASEATFDSINRLAGGHTGHSDEPADVADCANTLTGSSLAKLIGELNNTYDDDIEFTAAALENDSATGNATANGGASTEATIPPGLSVAFVNNTSGETALKEHYAESEGLSEETRIALEQQRATLAKEYEQRLVETQQAARNSIRIYKQRLAAEHRAKQQALLANRKKLIELANKISQQKAEIQRQREELANAPRLMKLSADNHLNSSNEPEGKLTSLGSANNGR